MKRISGAAKKLDEDMAAGVHLEDGFSAKALKGTNGFSAKRIAKRIDQKKEAAKPYGINPMQAADKKKKKKKPLAAVKNRPDISRAELATPYNNV